ncbi:hypothetical protein U9M48_040335 [Paspalum notatum var. saurae]|uniref:Uncharacterized protein n=1 Tax=Paspalum notatum var. saurae TaxID=547442 RepID=A0AAQ3XCA4_PASNO
MQDAEHMQDGGENLTDNENEDNLQVSPDIDNILARIPQQPTRPNGEKRKVVGSFGIANLLELERGKVMVGTDENGVPNERSASILGQHLGYVAESPTFAPLHIPRWDNELFKAHKEQIIKDVEVGYIERDREDDIEHDCSEHDCSDKDISGNYGDNDISNSSKSTNDNLYSSTNHMQPHVRKDIAQPSLHQEQRVTKEAQIESHSQVDMGNAGTSLPFDRSLINMRFQRVKAAVHSQTVKKPKSSIETRNNLHQ